MSTPRDFAVNGRTGEPVMCGCGDQIACDDAVCGNCDFGHSVDSKSPRLRSLLVEARDALANRLRISNDEAASDAGCLLCRAPGGDHRFDCELSDWEPDARALLARIDAEVGK